MYKLAAFSAVDPEYVFLAFDAIDAFNTTPRQTVFDAVAKRLPELSVVRDAWLAQPTSPTSTGNLPGATVWPARPPVAWIRAVR